MRPVLSSQRRSSLEIDLPKFKATWKGNVLTLGRKEMFLLVLLSKQPGYVRSREVILDYVWGDDKWDKTDRVVDTMIKRVRRRFQEVDPDFSMIQTIYGIGYFWKEHEND